MICAGLDTSDTVSRKNDNQARALSDSDSVYPGSNPSRACSAWTRFRTFVGAANFLAGRMRSRRRSMDSAMAVTAPLIRRLIRRRRPPRVVPLHSSISAAGAYFLLAMPLFNRACSHFFQNSTAQITPAIAPPIKAKNTSTGAMKPRATPIPLPRFVASTRLRPAPPACS